MFRVSARTVLQLGAELTSSDAVAFYELIKNAFDAGSKRVSVRGVERLPLEKIAELKELLHPVLEMAQLEGEEASMAGIVQQQAIITEGAHPAT